MISKHVDHLQNTYIKLLFVIKNGDTSKCKIAFSAVIIYLEMFSTNNIRLHYTRIFLIRLTNKNKFKFIKIIDSLQLHASNNLPVKFFHFVLCTVLLGVLDFDV